MDYQEDKYQVSDQLRLRMIIMKSLRRCVVQSVWMISKREIKRKYYTVSTHSMKSKYFCINQLIVDV